MIYDLDIWHAKCYNRILREEQGCTVPMLGAAWFHGVMVSKWALNVNDESCAFLKTEQSVVPCIK